MASITGWGRGAWSSDTWGEPNPVTLTGVAATSAVGSVTIVAKANVIPSSLVGTSGAPVAGVNAQAIASIQGAIGTVGGVSVDVDGEANVPVAGLNATGGLGSVIVHHNVQINITGVSATSSTGTLQGTFWSEVDDSNPDISWTEVHKAA